MPSDRIRRRWLLQPFVHTLWICTFSLRSFLRLIIISFVLFYFRLFAVSPSCLNICLFFKWVFSQFSSTFASGVVIVPVSFFEYPPRFLFEYPHDFNNNLCAVPRLLLLNLCSVHGGSDVAEFSFLWCCVLLRFWADVPCIPCYLTRRDLSQLTNCCNCCNLCHKSWASSWLVTLPEFHVWIGMFVLLPSKLVRFTIPFWWFLSFCYSAQHVVDDSYVVNNHVVPKIKAASRSLLHNNCFSCHLVV